MHRPSRESRRMRLGLAILCGVFVLIQGQGCPVNFTVQPYFADADFSGTWISRDMPSYSIRLDGSGNLLSSTTPEGTTTFPITLVKFSFTDTSLGDFKVTGPIGTDVGRGTMSRSKGSFQFSVPPPGLVQVTSCTGSCGQINSWDLR